MTRAIHLPTTRRPPLDEVEGDEGNEGDEQQHRRQCRGTRDIVALDLAVDVHRGNFGLVGDVAGDQDRASELADRTCERGWTTRIWARANQG